MSPAVRRNPFWSIALRTGRTTLLPGVVHLVMLAAYLFLSFVP